MGCRMLVAGHDLRCGSTSAPLVRPKHWLLRTQPAQARSYARMAQPKAGSGPFVLGLTGSIGMGKSTVSNMLRDLGVPVLEADAVVHKLYAQGGAAVQPVGQLFPSAVKQGAVDRTALSQCVVGNEAAMKQLEAVVHPLVEQERLAFLQQAAASGSHPLVVFDIPLLFETGGQESVDAVAVVSAPAEQQQQRVMARPGMTDDKFRAILARQVPDAVKREKADFVIDTGCSLEDTAAQVQQLVQQLAGRQGRVYDACLKP